MYQTSSFCQLNDSAQRTGSFPPDFCQSQVHLLSALEDSASCKITFSSAYKNYHEVQQRMIHQRKDDASFVEKSLMVSKKARHKWLSVFFWKQYLYIYTHKVKVSTTI